MRSLFLVVLLLLAAPTLAQEEAYTVTGVQVDVSAESAADAQAQAMGQAQNKAWAEVRRRLSLPLVPLDPAAVGDVSVEEEAFSATRYTGTFTVRFRPEAFGGAQGALPPPMEGGAIGVPPNPGHTLPPSMGPVLEATARFASLEEWVALRGALERTGLRPEVRALTSGTAHLAFATGDEVALRVALAEAGLVLTPRHEIVRAAP